MRTKSTYTAAQLRDLLSTQGDGAKQKIDLLFDAGTFAEVGTFVRRSTTEFDPITDDPKTALEGVVTGYGAIDGQLVFTYMQDASRMNGAISAAHADKICALYDLAMQNGAPVIGVFESAGAKVLEGISAMSAYGRIMKKVAEASGVIPQIAVISGICAGCNAAIAGMLDFRIGVENEGMLFAVSDGEQSTVTEDTMDLMATDIAEALAKARQLISYLPANNAEGGRFTFVDDLNRVTAIPEVAFTDGTYDMRALVRELANDGVFFEIAGGFGDALLTGFAHIGEQVVGVCASNPAIDGGKLNEEDTVKAARFVTFCDCFRIPLLTLVDSEGLIPDGSVSFANGLARLSSAYAGAVTPKVTVITGNAFGTAFTVLGSKALGADICLALDSAVISILPPDAAVQFVWGDKIAGAKDSLAEAESLKRDWVEDIASPLAAARCGAVDDVIAYTELRQRILAALGMLSAKCEVAPRRRHSNLPL